MTLVFVVGSEGVLVTSYIFMAYNIKILNWRILLSEVKAQWNKTQTKEMSSMENYLMTTAFRIRPKKYRHYPGGTQCQVFSTYSHYLPGTSSFSYKRSHEVTIMTASFRRIGPSSSPMLRHYLLVLIPRRNDSTVDYECHIDYPVVNQEMTFTAWFLIVRYYYGVSQFRRSSKVTVE
jgi:hypothetical protein